MRLLIALLALSIPTLAACEGDPTSPGRDAGSMISPGRDAGPAIALGEEHSGQFHLGPVDWAQTEWSNACGPYPAEVQAAEGVLLAGVSNEIATPGSLCDACIEVSTDMGRTAVLRVVTYGVTNEPGDIDVSPEAYAMLDQGEFPRSMSWRLVTCASSEILLQFQTEASQWWTSLWVRSPSVAIASVEVQSANHADWFALRLGGDGTYTDDGGFGEGAYTLRVTGANGATFIYAGDAVVGGELVRTGGNL